MKVEQPPTPPAGPPSEYSYEYYTEEEFAEEDAEVPPPVPKKAETKSETTKEKAHDPQAKDKATLKEAAQALPKPASLQEAAQADVDKAREAVALARQMAKDLERQYRRRFGENPRGSGVTSSGIPRDEEGREIPDRRRRARSPEPHIALTQLLASDAAASVAKGFSKCDVPADLGLPRLPWLHPYANYAVIQHAQFRRGSRAALRKSPRHTGGLGFRV